MEQGPIKRDGPTSRNQPQANNRGAVQRQGPGRTEQERSASGSGLQRLVHSNRDKVSGSRRSHTGRNRANKAAARKNLEQVKRGRRLSEMSVEAVPLDSEDEDSFGEGNGSQTGTPPNDKQIEL